MLAVGCRVCVTLRVLACSTYYENAFITSTEYRCQVNWDAQGEFKWNVTIGWWTIWTWMRGLSAHCASGLDVTGTLFNLGMNIPRYLVTVFNSLWVLIPSSIPRRLYRWCSTDRGGARRKFAFNIAKTKFPEISLFYRMQKKCKKTFLASAKSVNIFFVACKKVYL